MIDFLIAFNTTGLQILLFACRTILYSSIACLNNSIRVIESKNVISMQLEP